MWKYVHACAEAWLPWVEVFICYTEAQLCDVDALHVCAEALQWACRCMVEY